MTILLISAQDIRALSVGLVRDRQIVESKTVVASPETYLRTVAESLEAWNVTHADLDAVAVVTGPGSFTSSRVSVMIANGIAFANDIPVVGIPNPDRLPIEDLPVSSLAFPDPDRFAVPVYDRPPHITIPNP